MGYVKHTADDYFWQQVSLLPFGPAWALEVHPELEPILRAFSLSFGNVDADAYNLVVEMVPSDTHQLMPDWERVLGLPDSCIPDGVATYAQRRQSIIRRFNEAGSQTPAFFKSLVESYGYKNVVIEEHRPSKFGKRSRFGTARFGTWRKKFFWTIHLTDPNSAGTRFGGSTFGHSRWGGFGYRDIQCLVHKYKPSHTIVRFNFYGENQNGLS